MDSYAKLALQKRTKIKHRRMIPHLPLQKVSIKSKYDRITNDTNSNINRYKIGHESETWLTKRWIFDDEAMNAVEWMDLKHVLRQTKFHKKTQYVKIIRKCGPPMFDSSDGSRQNPLNALYVRLMTKHDCTYLPVRTL